MEGGDQTVLKIDSAKNEILAPLKKLLRTAGMHEEVKSFKTEEEALNWPREG